MKWQIDHLIRAQAAMAFLAHGLQHLLPPEQLVDRLFASVHRAGKIRS
jgi:hypothetical protein